MDVLPDLVRYWAERDPRRTALVDATRTVTYADLDARVNGWCIGHGVELAMVCDLRIASDRAQFGTFEVRRGMHPVDGGIVRLVNTAGVGVALEMLLTGEPISAERAHTANLVSRVVDKTDAGRAGTVENPL